MVVSGGLRFGVRCGTTGMIRICSSYIGAVGDSVPCSEFDEFS